MRKNPIYLIVLLFIPSFCYSQNADPLFKDNLAIKDMAGQLNFIFDSLSANKMAMKFYYKGAGDTTWLDKTFTGVFSEWEFCTKLEKLVDTVIARQHAVASADSIHIKADLKPIAFSRCHTWFIEVQKKINAINQNNSKVKNVVSDPPTFSQSFHFSDTAFKCRITPSGEDFELTVCKLKGNFNPPPASDICANETMSKDIDLTNFKTMFLRRMGFITKVDVKTDLLPLDSLASTIWKKWKKSIIDFDSKEKLAKEEETTGTALNKQIDGIEKKLDEILKGKRDSAASDFTANLTNRQAYERVFGPSPSKKYYRERLFDIKDTNAYAYRALSNGNISIDSLSLTTEAGYITSINIYPSEESIKLYNLSKITSIRRYVDLRSTREAGENLNFYFPLRSDSRKYGKWRIHRSRTSEPPARVYFRDVFLNLSDIITYKPRVDSIGDVLVQVTNRNISFVKGKEKTVNLQEKNISSFARLDIFTDLVGLAENKPNGILQADLKLDIGMLTQPISNNRYYSKFRFSLLHSSNVCVRLSKIENKLRYLPVARDQVRFFNTPTETHDDTLTKNTKYVRTIDILQFASLEAYIKFNLIRFESDFFIFTAYAGAGVVRVPLNDTLTGSRDGIPILQENKFVANALRFHYGAQGQFKITHNIGAELTLERIGVRLNKSDIIQVYNGYDVKERKDILHQSNPNNIYRQMILMSGIRLYYYLDRDQQKRLYARLQYFKDTRTRNDDFFTFQFGYSTDLKGLLKIFRSDKAD